MPVRRVQGTVPYPVSRHAGGYPSSAQGRPQATAREAGLKPTEGRLSYHTITVENLKFGRSLSWNVAREWLNGRNDAVIGEITRLMAE